MIKDEVVDAYNNRLTANLLNIKNMNPQQLERVKTIGSAADNLLKNKDFALFVHSFKFDRTDLLIDIKGHTIDDNALRIAISNQLIGIDEFISSLKRAVEIRNRVVTKQANAQAEADTQ
jgi:hypothetical protein